MIGGEKGRWLLSLAFVAAIAAVIIVGLRIYSTSFVAYPVAEHFLYESSAVRAELGDVFSARLAYLNSGEFGMVGSDGVAEYNFVVAGSRADGSVGRCLHRSGGEWWLRKGLITRGDGSQVPIEPQRLKPQARVSGP